MLFRYRGVSKDGRRVSGRIEAPDEEAAVARLKEDDAAVTKIFAAGDAGDRQGRRRAGRVSEKALSVMCSQFAVILGAGLPIVRTVELIAGQTGDKALRAILTQIAGDVASGLGLAQSLQQRGPGLPVTLIETVRSGEESGTLDVSFRRLHTYYDSTSKTKSRVRTAMVYPVFTLAVAAVVLVIVMTVAVPAFTQSFASMGVRLPLPTRILIAVSRFFSQYGLPVAGVLACGVLAYRAYLRSQQGALFHARQQLRMPGTGRSSLMKSCAQFSHTLATLLAAGLPVLRAVNTAASTLDNLWIGSAVARQLPNLEEGRPLGECLRAAGVLPEMLSEMAGIGEETGTLESTLDIVGRYYDNETELATKRALSLLEPVIVCILAFLVLFILLSVYLPMLSLYSNIG